MSNVKSFSGIIAAANSALEHVRKIVPRGANNSMAQKLFRQTFVVGWVKTQWDIGNARDSYDEAKRTRVLLEGDWKAYIELMARTAARIQAGNCGEQSSVAFLFLKELGIRPIEYMEYNDRNHAFVLINRPANIDIKNFAEWSKDAVVCDPWRDAVGLAGMLPVWYKSTDISSRYRLD